MTEDYSDLFKHVDSRTAEFKIKSRLEIKGYGSILRSLAKEEVTFTIHINSLLEVGKQTKWKEQGDLEVVLTHANEEFNSCNKRNENQRDYIVAIYDEGGNAVVVVPERFYWNYIPEKNRPSP